MCGITGIVTEKKIDKSKIINLIKHRGPDSDGFYCEKNLYLFHTRLSILDLSEKGNQPMYSKDGNYVIIFNGEIYNHLDIRNTHFIDFPFESTTDTETILYAFIKFGNESLKLFNGVFSFAIFNITSKELFIARDPLGVKPLYLYSDKSQFAFSSELKTFLALDIIKDIDYKTLSNYVSFLWSPGHGTMFKNVKKLLAGYYLRLNTITLEILEETKYYEIPFNGKYSQLTESELVSELEKKLLCAVERQMLSDVPVGFFLSGGLDSSLIVAMARKLFPDRRINCYTVNNEGGKSEGFSNDLFYAKKVATFLNVDLTIVDSSIDILKEFDEMIWHLDEPQADVAPLHVLNICRAARIDGIKVLLGGAGGDDLFSGYRRHQALNYEKYFRLIPRALAIFIKNGINNIDSNLPVIRRLKKLINDIDKSKDERILGYFLWLPDSWLSRILHKDIKTQMSNYKPLDSLFALLKKNPEVKDDINKMLFLELKTFLVDHNLNYTDKLSMAVGVETRVPYLDLEVVEFSTKIPPKLKMRGNETKYVLKKVAEKYLPHDVIYRPKAGFGAPIRTWVINELDELISERLSKEKIEARGLFDFENLSMLIEDNKKGKVDASYTILSALAIESWLIQFYDNKKYILK